MEWKELTTTSKNILERCWGLYDDNPRSVRVSIGETFKTWDKEYTFTESNYEEIVKYVKGRKDIIIGRNGDQIVVTGMGQFGVLSLNNSKN